MSDTSNLDNKEKLDILFKQYLGFPFTKETTPYYLETNVKYNNYIIGGDILTNSIPPPQELNAPYDSLNITLEDPDNKIQEKFNFLNIDLTTLTTRETIADTNLPKITMDPSGIIMKFEKLELTRMTGTDSWYCPKSSDKNKESVLENSIQFSYKRTPTNQYSYELFDENNVKILPQNGNWIFDIKTGTITFYDLDSVENISTSGSLYLSFYKYVGGKGLDNFTTKQTGIGGTSSTGNLGVGIEPNSLYMLDVSGDSNFRNNVNISGIVSINDGSLKYDNDTKKIMFKHSDSESWKVMGTGSGSSGGGSIPIIDSNTVINGSSATFSSLDVSGETKLNTLDVSGVSSFNDTIIFLNDNSGARIRYDTNSKKLQFSNSINNNEWQDFGATTTIVQVAASETATNSISNLLDIIENTESDDIFKPENIDETSFTSDEAFIVLKSSLVLDSSCVKIHNLCPAVEGGQPVEYSQFKYVLDKLTLLPDLTKDLNVETIQIISRLDVSGDTKLNTLDVSGETKLNTLDVSGETKLNTLDVSGDTKLNTLDVSGETKLNTLDVSGDISSNNINISNKIKISGGEIEFKDNKIKFHHGDGNWKELGTGTGTGGGVVETSSDKTASLFLSSSTSDISIFSTPNNVNDNTFLLWKDTNYYFNNLNTDQLFEIINNLNNDTLISIQKTLRDNIFNLPEQLLIPRPTDLSKNVETNIFTWKYKTSNIDYTPDGFLLYFNDTTDPINRNKYVLITPSEYIYNLETEEYSYNYTNGITNDNTYFIYSITSFGKSLRYSKC